MALTTLRVLIDDAPGICFPHPYHFVSAVVAERLGKLLLRHGACDDFRLSTAVAVRQQTGAIADVEVPY